MSTGLFWLIIDGSTVPVRAMQSVRDIEVATEKLLPEFEQCSCSVLQTVYAGPIEQCSCSVLQTVYAGPIEHCAFLMSPSGGHPAETDQRCVTTLTGKPPENFHC